MVNHDPSNKREREEEEEFRSNANETRVSSRLCSDYEFRAISGTRFGENDAY